MAPVEMARGFQDLAGVAANSAAAFVIERTPGVISRIELATGETSPLVALAGAPSAILAFENRVVWADYGHASVSSLSLLAGGAPISTMATGPPRSPRPVGASRSSRSGTAGSAR